MFISIFGAIYEIYPGGTGDIIAWMIAGFVGFELAIAPERTCVWCVREIFALWARPILGER